MTLMRDFLLAWFARIAAIIALIAMFASPVLSRQGDGAIYSALDQLFEDARLDIKAPSLVYGVVANGELKHSGRFGTVALETKTSPTDRTRYRIASMTKMMTALLVLDLQDRGLLFLDAPAETYFDRLADLEYPTADSRKITVRDLLNHTTGFVTDNAWADRQMDRTSADLDAFIAQAQPFNFVPGGRYEYSNFGFALLGRIIENVSGNSYAKQLSDRIFDPLDMRNTTVSAGEIPAGDRPGAYNWVDDEYRPEPVQESGAFDPIGGVWTTVEDYARFVGWMLSAWPPRDDPEATPIPRRVVRSVTDGVFMIGAGQGSGLSRADDCIMASAYSMGLRIRSHCDAGLMLMHGGGFPGFGSYVIMMPELGVGVFAFANETYADVYGPVWDAARELIASDLAAGVVEHQPDSRLLTAYDGVFASYLSGDIQAGSLNFADNFFLDRDKTRWNRQLSELRKGAGLCTKSALQPWGRVSGEFTWTCESGRIAGFLIQSPLDPDHVQQLHLRLLRRDGNGADLVIDEDFH